MIFSNLFKNRVDHIDWHLQRQYIILRALVPKTNDKTPLAAEHFFAALHGIYQQSLDFQEIVSMEIAAVNGYVQFFFAVPEHLINFIEGQLYAQYPIVEVEKVDDYMQSVHTEGVHIAATELTLNKSDVYPIKTFLNFDVDPLASITGVLAEASGQEHIIVQLLVRPSPSSWQEKGIHYVNQIKSGKKPDEKIKEILKKRLLSATGHIAKEIFVGSQTTTENKPPEIKLSAPEDAALKGIEEKITKLGFESLVRIAVVSPDESSAERKLHSTVGAFRQFNTNNMNSFEAGDIIKDKSIIQDLIRRYFKKGYVLNIEELASLFHLPNTSVETPRLTWSGSKKGEPPTSLPIVADSDEDITKFGETNFRGHYEPFGIKQQDRSLHMYAIGKTGTGKSTMLENMIIDDMRKGRGVAVVDPHGDLIKKILDFIPKERVDDVIFFNPADREFPVAFNILENVDPDLKNIVASGVVGIFKKIFGESWGPRLEYILRNTVLALLDYPNATMLGILRVLNDQSYRLRVIEKIKDPVIRDFFINEFEKYDQKFRSEAIAPIQNKVGQFLSSSTIRNIVGQPKSSFSLEEIMDNKKILLLDLSIGKIGEDNSALLGAMMITKMQLSAMSRANLPPEQRVPFYLFVDEFQNFATDSFAVILSEARKYKLNLIMTNQYIAQMPEPVASAIFGNVGTLISFRVGAGDAAALEQEVAPVFTANDLVNLDNYHIYLKMAVDGVTTTPFSARTLQPASEPDGLTEEVTNKSREKYGKHIGIVEKEISEAAEFVTVDENVADFIKKKSREIDKSKNNTELDGKTYKKIVDANNDRWYFEQNENTAGDK